MRKATRRWPVGYRQNAAKLNLLGLTPCLLAMALDFSLYSRAYRAIILSAVSRSIDPAR